MPLSFVEYPGHSSEVGPYSFNFPYIDQIDIKCYRIGRSGTKEILTGYTFPTESTVTLARPIGDGPVLRIARVTPIDTRDIVFQDGSNLDEEDLEGNALQNFYVMQEIWDAYREFGDKFEARVSRALGKKADWNHAHDAFGTIAATIATSATRPAVTDGLIVSETDTGRIVQVNAAGEVTGAAMMETERGVMPGNKVFSGDLNLTGNTDTRSGTINVSAPTGPTHAASKAYVDRALKKARHLGL